MATDDVIARKGPQRIGGRYELTARLGRGAMGVVYQARDEVMRRDVALKVLTADLEDDPEIKTRFLREAQAAAGLSHPNVITIFDVGEENERFYIVMELLRGMVLKSFLKQPESARLGRKIHLMMQLCAGLSAAHHASVYHRDIKPGNVFVRSDGLLKILDFGVARLATSNMTASGFVVGTPDYMSPEQARGEEIDGRSDIFSAGGVFYYMLTGRKPFAATALPTLFHQIQSEDPQPIDGDVPPELAAVVMKALSKKRETRYQSCEELIADLQLMAHLYPVEALDRAALPLVADLVSSAESAAAPTIAGSSRQRQAAEAAPAAPSTDDTMELATPVATDVTDDTVSLDPPTWGSKIKAGIDAAIAGVAARWTRTSAPVAARQSSRRKR
ncbi:MAG TPA: serine/threonine-protein kinase [Vicinamibacterales bacterium]|nr:serine/threonine-protein kinase [Vicinamibacterales bacterium]